MPWQQSGKNNPRGYGVTRRGLGVKKMFASPKIGGAGQRRDGVATFVDERSSPLRRVDERSSPLRIGGTGQRRDAVATRKAIVLELDALIEILEHRRDRVILSKACRRVQLVKRKNKQFEAEINALYEQILNTRDAHIKELFRESLKQLYAGHLTGEDLIKNFNQYLGKDLANDLLKPMQVWSEIVYKLGMNEVSAGIRLGYNVHDQRAVELVNNNNIFFIGEYYNNTNGDVMRNEIKELFSGELTRNKIADSLLELVALDREKGAHYFEGFIEHASSRIRNIGNVAGYIKAGIDYAEVFATLDDSTSEICKEMHGRIIPVSQMKELADDYLNIETEGRSVADVKADLKRLVPFVSAKEFENIRGCSTAMKLLNCPGLAMPPYHWRCRTETIAYFPDEEQQYDYNNGNNLSDETKKCRSSYNEREIANKINAIEMVEKPRYNAWDLENDDKHFDKFGVKNADEYVAKAYEIIETANTKAFRVYMQGGVDPDFQLSYFGKDGYVTVDTKGEIRGLFDYQDCDNASQYLKANGSYVKITKKGKKNG